MTESGNCEQCEKEGEHVTASYYCQECEERMCNDCTKFHRRNKILKEHEVVLISELGNGARGGSFLAQYPVRCDAHNNQKFEYICLTHDTICCSRCVIDSHRACKDVQELDKYVKSECHVTRERQMFGLHEDQKERTEREIKKEENRLAKIENNHKDNIKAIANFEESLIAFCKHFVKEERDRLKGFYTECKEKHQHYLKQLKIQSEKTNEIDASVSKYGSENSVVRKVRFVRDTLKSLNENKQQMQTPSVLPGYSVDFKFDEILTKMKSQTEAVWEKNDTDIIVGRFCLDKVMALPHVSDLVVLETGLLFCIDKINRRMCLYNRDSLQLVSTLKTKSEPFGVAVIRPNTVAVSFPNENKIELMIMSGYKVSSTRTIPETVCTLLSTCDFKGQQVFLAKREFSVDFYNTSGEKVHGVTINRHLSLDVVSFCALSGKELLFFSYGKKNKLVVFTFEGVEVKVFNNANIRRPMGITATRKGEAFVCGFEDHHIHRIDMDEGCVVETVLEHCDGIRGPLAIAFSLDMRTCFVIDDEKGRELKTFRIKQGKLKVGKNHFN